MPFFSIIIPVYNSAGTLQQTLDSITNQIFKNYELVFVDGNSSDDTLHIINDLEHLNTGITIQLISEPDKGIYDAMNKANCR